MFDKVLNTPLNAIVSNLIKNVAAKVFLKNGYFHSLKCVLTHLFPVHLSLPPGNIRKPYGFLMFPGGRRRVHWEQMG